MRSYFKSTVSRRVRPDLNSVGRSAAPVVPGFRLTEVIDQFYIEGVVPDFLPADLGVDDSDEVDADGLYLVDPEGDIRTDPFEARERALLSGVDVFINSGAGFSSQDPSQMADSDSALCNSDSGSQPVESQPVE